MPQSCILLCLHLLFCPGATASTTLLMDCMHLVSLVHYQTAALVTTRLAAPKAIHKVKETENKLHRAAWRS